MNMIDYEARRQVYLKAIEHFGAKNQVYVAIEEMAEAQKELTKMLRGEGDLIHLAEEIADAAIMLEQIRLVYGLNEAVCGWMDKKVQRLKGRVNEWN